MTACIAGQPPDGTVNHVMSKGPPRTGRQVTFGKIRAHALAAKVDVSNRTAVFYPSSLAVSG